VLYSFSRRPRRPGGRYARPARTRLRRGMRRICNDRASRPPTVRVAVRTTPTAPGASKNRPIATLALTGSGRAAQSAVAIMGNAMTKLRLATAIKRGNVIT
jgi:hypothetical protein